MEREQAYEILKNKTYKDETEKQNCLDIIKKDPNYAYHYARDVIKDENFWENLSVKETEVSNKNKKLI